MNEKELVKLARGGDKQAFCDLYIMYKDRLYRYAFFKLGNRDDALDAVSSCITNAYSSISTLKNDKAFSSWIFKILYRSCSQYVKAQIIERGQESIDDMTAQPSYDMNFDTPELMEALNILNQEDREIVLLSAICDLNSKEIARLMDIPANTVRSKLSRALGRMRSFLE